MTKKVSREALEKEYEAVKAKYSDQRKFWEFLDGLPDGPDKNIDVPFPYGSPRPRPYGWDF